MSLLAWNEVVRRKGEKDLQLEDFGYDEQQLARETRWLAAHAARRYPERLERWYGFPVPEAWLEAERLPEEVEARLEKVLDEWEERTRRQDKDEQFLNTVAEDLQRHYPGHWVAIYQCQVIAASPSLDRLKQTLAERAIPRKKAFFRYLPSADDAILIPTFFETNGN